MRSLQQKKDLRAERLQQLREVKSGIRTRREQYKIEEAEEIFDTVTDEEFRKIQKERMKDNFVVDDVGLYNEGVIENWDQEEKPIEPIPKQRTIIEAFNKKPKIVEKRKMDDSFLDDLLSNLDQDLKKSRISEPTMYEHVDLPELELPELPVIPVKQVEIEVAEQIKEAEEEMDFEIPMEFPETKVEETIKNEVPDMQDKSNVLVYFLDLVETNSNLYLFGKIKTEKEYVSCAILIQNIERNVYFLPKNSNAEDLHAEFMQIRKKLGIKKSAVEFIKRKNPFLGLDEQMYMRVNYSFSDAVIPDNFKSGKCYSHMFGSSTSMAETVILDKKLKGPCWLKIQNLNFLESTFSWCKLEGRVCISHIQHTDQFDPPPLVVMVLSLKTQQNAKQSEISLVTSATYVSDQMIPKSHLTFVKHQKKLKFPKVLSFDSERRLLDEFIQYFDQIDCDVICGHNVTSDLELLVQRMIQLGCNVSWSKLGRLRRTKTKGNPLFRLASGGRLVVDTYLSSRELIPSSKSYSLNYLAETQLGEKRNELNYSEISKYFLDNTISELIHYNFQDCLFICGLLRKQNCLWLYKQLSAICGCLWSKTMVSGRAERNEYLLLHEFHKDYIVPDKKTKFIEKSKKPQYSGGLVLEPKKGFYDTFVLLLDFNSLYPSIIREYNLCFCKNGQTILPRLLEGLIQRRKSVKQLIQAKQGDLGQLNIRQLALKLTANSLYGCLGFEMSRFYCKELAMEITQKGRDILQSTVDLANKHGMEVIYGDTDSIMIHTQTNDLVEVKKIGQKLKKLVNERYKHLEIEMDGFFRRLLLLKKKKYAALVITDEKPKLEIKGLDLVRRDWCLLSKDASSFVLKQLMESNEPKEQVVNNIHVYLTNLSSMVRELKIPMESFVITKSLTKATTLYNDSQPHVSVAKSMELKGEKIKVGSCIPYVIIKSDNDKSIASRARHPSETNLESLDLEWYITQQILPPVVRLCCEIDMTSQEQIAHCLGLESKKYKQQIVEEKFENVEGLNLECSSCDLQFQMTRIMTDSFLGTTCPGCLCELDFKFVVLQLRINLRRHIKHYKLQNLVCEDSTCAFSTKPMSVFPWRCFRYPFCNGSMQQQDPPHQLYKQLMFFINLFDLEKFKKNSKLSSDSQIKLKKLEPHFIQSMEQINSFVSRSAYNKVSLSSIFNFLRNK